MAVYQSYPPNILMLPGKHDLMLVGTVTPGTLDVAFTWDSDGRSASIDFGDGASDTNADESASHTYAANGTYTATVRSGQASDSAVLTLEVAAEPEDEPVEPDSTPEAPQSTPEPDDGSESLTEPTEAT